LAKQRVLKVVDYFKTKTEGAFDYVGGVPTSLLRTGQQWDFSNAWPPLQELLIEGLDKTGE